MPAWDARKGHFPKKHSKNIKYPFLIPFFANRCKKSQRKIMKEKVLVICEKQIAAKRIALILSDGKGRERKLGRVPIFEFDKDGQLWNVLGLRGHILRLDYPKKCNQWKAISLEELIRTKPEKEIVEKAIHGVLRKLIPESSELIVATDYDREGELIGVESFSEIDHGSALSIKRAVFSALTRGEITGAFSELGEVNYRLADAAGAREHIDLMWGAVLTRFISLASGQLGKKFISVGRVQSPTLALIVEREKQIESFTPIPYWDLWVDAGLKSTGGEVGQMVSFTHRDQPFWEEPPAREKYEKIKGEKEAEVTRVEKKKAYESPPPPFNTTEFLKDATRLGFMASIAMSIAESLYRKGMISYPRTDNQVYPPTMNRTIADRLIQSGLFEGADRVVKSSFSPTRGKFAHDHPPIHPVDLPRNLTEQERKIYDLVARRFLATLSRKATCEWSEMEISIKGEPFGAKGYKILDAGWKRVYPFTTHREKILPAAEKGDKLVIKKISIKKNETEPPRRYNQADLISEMEKLGLGTKSTRHEILKKLYDRRFVYGSSIKPTSLAIAVVGVLNQHGSKMTSSNMTAQLELEMNRIEEGKKQKTEVVEESKEMLSRELKILQKHKQEIGKDIGEAIRNQNTVGRCPMCGGTLLMRRSSKGDRFIGCSGYPDCRNTYSLPKNSRFSFPGKTCETCGAPIIKISFGRKSIEKCINTNCGK
jgi:DNA topoisomerase-1